MSRFSPKSEEELNAAGYEPINLSDSARYTKYGVPIVQKGLTTLLGLRFHCWAPSWAVQLITEWPFPATGLDDFDHRTLKMAIIAIVERGDSTLVDAFLTVARLGGVAAVLNMLEEE